LTDLEQARARLAEFPQRFVALGMGWDDRYQRPEWEPETAEQWAAEREWRAAQELEARLANAAALAAVHPKQLASFEAWLAAQPERVRAFATKGPAERHLTFRDWRMKEGAV
jgi:hypothetical protein